MHYTGTIWRPPYEAPSLLLEVTAGCTHHRCKFCTLYEELPFKFRMSPLADIEEDLIELKGQSELWPDCHGRRVFLTGANPFVLKYGRLMEIASLIHRYHPAIETIGCFARVTDVTAKTDKELSNLRLAGYDGITIGIETGDDEALTFMDKGYLASDIIRQCSRLDEAGISYNFFYLTGISGAGRGNIGAKATAEVCNQLHPVRIGANMLTIYSESGLYQEIQKGNWKEEGELGKYMELQTLVKKLKIPVYFGALGASNAFQLQGILPRDKEKLLYTLDRITETVSEEELQRYRRDLPHL